jgi:hypothetical protein
MSAVWEEVWRVVRMSNGRNWSKDSKKLLAKSGGLSSDLKVGVYNTGRKQYGKGESEREHEMKATR